MNGEGTVELVLLVMVAGFIVLRLRSVLGRRVGFERGAAPAARPDATGRVIEGSAEPVPPTRDLPAADSLAGKGLQAIRQADPSFDAHRFLAGAEAAFRIIVGAFARGDRVALHPLLGPDTYAAFEGAIAAREAAGETQAADIKAMQDATIVAAGLKGSVASITVRLVSDQVSTTLDKDGAPVHGTDAVTELTDVWTFERDVRQGGPAWLLVDARTG